MVKANVKGCINIVLKERIQNLNNFPMILMVKLMLKDDVFVFQQQYLVTAPALQVQCVPKPAEQNDIKLGGT